MDGIALNAFRQGGRFGVFDGQVVGGDDVLHLLTGGAVHQGPGLASAANAPGAADAVDEGVHVVGHVVVDDLRHGVHVDAAGRDVGGDDDAHLTLTEAAEDALTLVL